MVASEAPIERLIRRHKDRVYRQLVRTCGNHDDAEDALAVALYAAIKASEQLSNPDHFHAWISRIGSRACARLRIRSHLSTLVSIEQLQDLGIDFPSQKPDPLAELEQSTLKACVQGAISRLDPLHQAVYRRRELERQTAEQVATELGLSISAVKSRLHRARLVVRRALDEGLGCGEG